MKKYIFILLSLLTLASCSKDKQDNESWKNLDESSRQRYFVNQFAYNMISVYYLWKDEIADGLKLWKTTDDPIAKVRELRYKDATGKDIDKWTVVTDDFESFQGQVTGNTKSMGFDFNLYYADASKEYVAIIINFTYPDSPAYEAGIKRGDVIVALNDEVLTPANYKTLINSTILGGGSAKLTFADGSEKSLTAVQMYLNPVTCYKVIEKGGRKIGYLHFASFTLDAAPDLVNVFRDFTNSGITELVLDLRYNGGGYMTTSEVLSSLIAPPDYVEAGAIFQRDIYNSILTEAWGESITRFTTDFSIEGTLGDYTVSTKGINPCISKLHVIMTGSSASASESTVCGLMPYMDISLVGQKSYGKYCGGYIVDGKYWYDLYKSEMSEESYNAGIKYTDNWGVYVMVSRYADKDGNTPCMPDGFQPDIEVEDNPLDGHQLGDEDETMLAAALAGKAPAAKREAGTRSHFRLLEEQYERPNYAIYSNLRHK